MFRTRGIYVQGKVYFKRVCYAQRVMAGKILSGQNEKERD